MIKHIIQKCIILALTVGYILFVLLFQKLPCAEVIDTLSVLVLGLWAYIILDDFDMKVLDEHRMLTKKHIAYELLFIASLAMITAAFLSHKFAWALAMLIGSILTFIGGCVMYGYCFKHEDEFISMELDNAHHMVFVLTHLKNKAEDWDAEKLEEYATKEFHFYPKANHLERGLDGFAPIDATGNFRTLAQMNADDPNSAEAIIARKRIKAIVADYLSRKAEKDARKAAKRQPKEAK